MIAELIQSLPKVRKLQAEITGLKHTNREKNTEIKSLKKERNTVKEAVYNLTTILGTSTMFKCSVCLEETLEDHEIVFSPCGHRKTFELLKISSKLS